MVTKDRAYYYASLVEKILRILAATLHAKYVPLRAHHTQQTNPGIVVAVFLQTRRADLSSKSARGRIKAGLSFENARAASG